MWIDNKDINYWNRPAHDLMKFGFMMFPDRLAAKFLIGANINWIWLLRVINTATTRLLPHSDGPLLAEKESWFVQFGRTLVTLSTNSLSMLIIACWLEFWKTMVFNEFKWAWPKMCDILITPQHGFSDGKINLSWYWYTIGFFTLYHPTLLARSCKCESPTDTKRVMRFAWMQWRRSVHIRTEPLATYGYAGKLMPEALDN